MDKNFFILRLKIIDIAHYNFTKPSVRVRSKETLGQGSCLESRSVSGVTLNVPSDFNAFADTNGMQMMETPP